MQLPRIYAQISHGSLLEFTTAFPSHTHCQVDTPLLNNSIVNESFLSLEAFEMLRLLSTK
jgi:hypothetical protein